MWKRFLFVSDLHGLDYDSSTIDAVTNWIADNKPERVVVGGDVWNFDALRKGANESEKASGIMDDYEAGKRLLAELRPTDVMMGNHDFRLWKLAEDSGLVAEYASECIRQIQIYIKSLRADFYEYDCDTVCHLGTRLKCHHGLFFNMHTAKASAEYFGDVLVGHTHSVDYYRSRSLTGTQAWACGCACNLRPMYAKTRASTARWRNAFAVGEYHTSKPMYTVQIIERREDGTFR